MTLDPGGGSDLVATLHVAAAPVVRDRLFEVIGDRRSNRSEDTADPIAEASLTAIGALAESRLMCRRCRDS